MILPDGTILEHRYRIDRLLAQGGMGVVYQGFDTKLQTQIAIKGNHFRTPEGIEQFEQESLILARLRHPSLPRVIDHFTYDEYQYMVMDFVNGDDLWEIIQQQGQPLEERLAVNYLLQVCDAVSYLHNFEPPIIHRDIKPQNIKITPNGQAVLVDFGIAKLIAADETRTQTGARGITPGFSPPEQYSGEGTMVASDIYALGATLYAIVTGIKPPDSIRLVTGRATLEPPNVVNQKVSLQLSHVIEHAMQPHPENRPPDVRAWRQELQTTISALSLLENQPYLSATNLIPPPAPVKESPPIADIGHTIPSTTRPRVAGRAAVSLSWGVILALVLVLVLVVGGVAFWIGSQQQRNGFDTTEILAALAATSTAQSLANETTPSPSPTETATPTPVPATETATSTASPVPPTATATSTATPTATSIATSIAADIAPLLSPSPVSPAPQLLFRSNRGGQWAVYQVEVTATPVSQLVAPLPSPPYLADPLAWSPDRQRVAFSGSQDNLPGIFLFDLEATTVRRLSEQAETSNLAWSPDGQRIVFDAGDKIDVLNVDGSPGFTIAQAQGDNYPVISPNGQTVIFDTEHSASNFDIFAVNLDGSNLRQLTLTESSNERQPAWSPDGQQIAFTYEAGGTGQVIYLMQATGESIRPLTMKINAQPYDDQQPRWSPDGQQIAFTSNRTGNNEIYVINVDGTGLQQLTDHPADDVQPAWAR